MKTESLPILFLAACILALAATPSCNRPGTPEPTVSAADSILSADLSRQGIMFALSGQKETALQIFDEAIKANPLNANAYGGRGMVKLGLDDLEGAYDDASRAIEMDSLNGDWYGNRSYISMLWGKYPEALADLDRSVSLSPKYSWAYVKRGNVRFLMNDTSGACSDWKVAAGMGEQEAIDSALLHCPGFTPEEPPVTVITKVIEE